MHHVTIKKADISLDGILQRDPWRQWRAWTSPVRDYRGEYPAVQIRGSNSSIVADRSPSARASFPLFHVVLKFAKRGASSRESRSLVSPNRVPFQSESALVSRAEIRSFQRRIAPFRFTPQIHTSCLLNHRVSRHVTGAFCQCPVP